MWNHYLSSEVGYTYFTWSLELPKGFQFINKASIISPSPLPKHHGTQRNSKGHWVSDSLAPPWREIQPTPWRAALTGHVKGDNPLSSPSFVGHFTFVQSWHIRRLDNKGTYSLKKNKWQAIDNGDCVYAHALRLKYSHPHNSYDLPIAFTWLNWPLSHSCKYNYVILAHMLHKMSTGNHVF